ncbi:MAG: hypothetical protein OXC95_00215 [Dehalococcoidia bacterium]|nr:hypothetical protein [Dehalococcoidia bacterium]
MVFMSLMLDGVAVLSADLSWVGLVKESVSARFDAEASCDSSRLCNHGLVKRLLELGFGRVFPSLSSSSSLLGVLIM